jgi:hypothetical protein
VHCLVAVRCILIFKLSFQSHVSNFYRANFYPDISLGLAQPHQFLSRKSPLAFHQNGEISIWTDLHLRYFQGSCHSLALLLTFLYRFGIIFITATSCVPSGKQGAKPRAMLLGACIHPASYPSVIAGLKENTSYIRYELFCRNLLTNTIIYFQTPNSYFSFTLHG